MDIDRNIKLYTVLLLMSDASDEEVSDSSEESEAEKILLHLASECITENQQSTQKRINRFMKYHFAQVINISKELAIYLSKQFEKSSHYKRITHKGRNSLSAKNHIYVFLWFISHKGMAYRHVARHFRISVSTVHIILQRVALFLNDLAPNVIRWPDRDERALAAENFHAKTGIQGIVGCIGYTCINTELLQSHPTSTKHVTPCSIIPVQAVCNDECKFIEVFIGDSECIFNNSLFDSSCLEQKLTTFLDEDEHLVGDTSFPCLLNLIVPFDNSKELSASHKSYNKNINFCVKQIEQCFSDLKEKFQVMSTLKVRNGKLQQLIIKSCFVLYNLSFEHEQVLSMDHNYSSNTSTYK